VVLSPYHFITIDLTDIRDNQVANQQGRYLAGLLNRTHGEVPDSGSKDCRPFCYRHLGSLAYIGGDSAVADFTGSLMTTHDSAHLR
jgi:NADH dehydrogenase FAD-containing subunit